MFSKLNLVPCSAGICPGGTPRAFRLFRLLVFSLVGAWFAHSVDAQVFPTVPGALPNGGNPTTVPGVALSSSATLNISTPRSLANPARLSNVSIRARAGNGFNALTVGAVVQGSGSLPLLMRAVGPGLAAFGLSNFLRDPRLDVYRGSALAARATTLGAGAKAASAYLGAFPLLEAASGTPGDAALVGAVSAGTLTAQCSSATSATGAALLEFYDVAAAPGADSARFSALTSRALIDAGDGAIILGFVVTGEGSLTLLLRGIGPSITQGGVPPAENGNVRDPVIELYAGSRLVASNDTWLNGDSPAVEKVIAAEYATGAFPLVSSKDAALVATLRAGSYSLVVSTVDGQGGFALAEVREVPETPVRGFDLARSLNTTGLELFRQVASEKPNDTLIVSPYSIAHALALTFAGADGITRDEMARVLHFPGDDAAVQTGFADLRAALDQLAADSVGPAALLTRNGTATDPIVWSSANRLFGQQTYPFRDTFLASLNDGYAAPLQVVDFAANFEAARATINNWVTLQTRQKINNLLPLGSITDTTRLVLVNALYLKAPWADPFSKSATADRTFRPATGAPRQVSTMARTWTTGYAAEDGMSIVTLDYLGNGLQFVVILPDEGKTVAATAAKLTDTHFARWANLRSSGAQYVSLQLPKFTAAAGSIQLGAAFERLGMPTAFDHPKGSANFDRMAPRNPPNDYLLISDVYHQTFVAIDESSTEAAAATGVVVAVPVSATITPVPIVVNVDRPFLFAIQHRASGACLFFGSMMDPK